MAFTDKKIDGSTQIKNFPKTYNDLIDELVTEINRLNDLVSSKDTEIQKLRSQMAVLQSDLRAYFSAWFDQKMNEFENEFVKKTNN
jgi:phage shock protein A